MTFEPAVRSIAQQNNSAVDLVTAEIRRSILTGALPAGEQFSIRDLARQLGVSHIPIREALRRLENQGLVVLKQARSAAVASLTTADMESIYALRLRIEPHIAEESVSKHTTDQLERLHELLERSRAIDPEIAWEAHHDFHAALVEPIASEWDLRVLETLWVATERYSHLVFDPTTITPEERQHRYDRHELLLSRVVAGDGPGLQRELREHLKSNEDDIRERIAYLERIKLERPTA
ncbi:GntR family transcriptional regulator [Subtercola lobariae]|uniref:GntR family transcriptional regulator n=1 Tax=Subtercola lobariae TaxID=1588641 RepID=A0A917EY69_9MICO|nr:GntR family transcriptional regulator [Subtercola lobariae]GGF21425.1 GntR family transcriptional regulator [Subtercola lobariae]